MRGRHWTRERLGWRPTGRDPPSATGTDNRCGCGKKKMYGGEKREEKRESTYSPLSTFFVSIKWILIILSLASLSNFSSPFGATSAFPTIRHLYGVSEPSQRFKIILLTVA
ncbi:hypothetical protein Bca4012_052754 [Brassica carinata]